VVASMAAASAQAMHPMPINGQMPGANQQAQPNARATMQQVPQQQMNQQLPQGSPAQNPQQQNPQQFGQQPGMRPADPPSPTTPPAPPVVTYRDGMLTVQALNSTLGSVLAAIRSKAGIEFEGLENAPERVAISLGPAPSGEVLSAIFAGSKFDFIAIGRPDSPDVVQRVILSPKKGTPAPVASQQPARQNSGEGDDEDTPDETVNVGDPQDTPVQPPPTQAQQQQPEPQQQPKTPEQLLQELQEMRKQQEQQQQGVTPNPAQVPRKQPPLN